MVKEGGLLVTLPKLVNAGRVLSALPTLSDTAATVRRAIPGARLTNLARDLTEALGQLALAASNAVLAQPEPRRAVRAA